MQERYLFILARRHKTEPVNKIPSQHFGNYIHTAHAQHANFIRGSFRRWETGDGINKKGILCWNPKGECRGWGGGAGAILLWRGGKTPLLIKFNLNNVTPGCVCVCVSGAGLDIYQFA